MHTALTKDTLFPRGPLGRLGRNVLLFNEIESTNACLLARAAELPDGTVACAEYQTAGRGRLGRSWEAPRGAAVLISVLLKEPADSRLVALATLVGALAACEAIEQATLCRPTVRWPNDIVLSGRKAGGVLVESTPVPPAATRALAIGVGINCLQQRGHFAGALAHTATSLEIESPQPVDRGAVARHLLECLDAHLASPATEHDARAILAAWKRRCEDLGAHVSLQHDRHTYAGTVLDIDDNGDLLVQLDEGARRYFAAATTTRRAEPS